MLAMYNTSEDGNLIKEILGFDKLRNEWGTALRAGVEKAPSFQHLLEIEEIIDENTLKLVQPLRMRCPLKYEPEIFSVQMLENIVIKNITITSKWNGLFRHHGFPLYYSVNQSQEMDYGWNAINMKRVADGLIENVTIKNFTNPLYVMDSRNVTCNNLRIKGYDGHQGIKIYGHACDNLFKNIIFYNHYADMLGGEGNAYGNVFTNIHYVNPTYKPVDFDFHGFSEGPFSPPAWNLFECITGFRHIKGAGAMYNQPACAQHNVWWNIQGEGEKKGSRLFISLAYKQKYGLAKTLSLFRHTLVKAVQAKNISPSFVKNIYTEKLKIDAQKQIPLADHQKLFPTSLVQGFNTTCTFYDDKNHKEYIFPTSLYEYQLKRK